MRRSIGFLLAFAVGLVVAFAVFAYWLRIPNSTLLAALVPTATYTLTPSSTPTPTPTETFTPTFTFTPTSTFTPSATFTPSLTPTVTNTPLPTVTFTPVATKETGGWEYSKTTSALGDTTTIIVLSADASVNVDTGEVTPVLAVRCSGKRLEVFVDTGTIIQPDSTNPDTSVSRVKFDSESPNVNFMSNSSDNKAMFFLEVNVKDVVTQIASHNVMAFEFTPFESGPVSTTFTLQGFNKAAEPLLQQCDLSQQ
jgi:hypothetical protein